MTKKSLSAKAAALMLAAVSLAFMPSPSLSLEKTIAKQWKELAELLDDAAVLRDKRERLPEKSLLGSDQQKTDAKINKTLKKAREILLSSDGQKLIKRSDQIKERLAELPGEIEEYRNNRISAPSSSYNPLTTTVKGYDEKIAQAESDIKRLNAELSEIQASLVEELRSWGLNLTDKQAETMFSTVIGDSLIDNATVYHNIKDVAQQLAELMSRDKNDMSAARKYYAMYLTLIDLLIDTQRLYIQQIDGDWLPAVESISSDAAKSKKDAEAGLKRSDYSEAQKKVLKSNISTNALTIKAASQYAKLLSQQKSASAKSIEALTRDREIAENTYSTVKHVSDISDVIKASFNAADLIAAMEPPELQAFDGGGLREQMDEITKRLQTKQP